MSGEIKNDDTLFGKSSLPLGLSAKDLLLLVNDNLQRGFNREALIAKIVGWKVSEEIATAFVDSAIPPPSGEIEKTKIFEITVVGVKLFEIDGRNSRRNERILQRIKNFNLVRHLLIREGIPFDSDFTFEPKSIKEELLIEKNPIPDFCPKCNQLLNPPGRTRPWPKFSILSRVLFLVGSCFAGIAMVTSVFQLLFYNYYIIRKPFPYLMGNLLVMAMLFVTGLILVKIAYRLPLVLKLKCRLCFWKGKFKMRKTQSLNTKEVIWDTTDFVPNNKPRVSQTADSAQIKGEKPETKGQDTNFRLGEQDG